jgi:hypothetical protein
MIGKVFRYAFLAGVGLAAMAVPAQADPISIGLLGIFGVTAAAGSAAVALTTFALQAVSGIGLSFASRLLAKKPKLTATGTGSVVDQQFGTETNRTLLIGTCRTDGVPRYFKGVGYSNKEVHEVYDVSDWTCDGLDGVFVDNEKRALIPVAIPPGNTEHERFHVDGYGTLIVLKFFKGTFPQSADAELIAASQDTLGSSMTYPNGDRAVWTVDHRGDGIAKVHTIFKFDEEKLPTIPRLSFVVRGAPLYDWRKDSTAGGSGPHRWADPATWEFSKNPAVAQYNYLRGFWRNGVRLGGMDCSPADLLIDYFTAAANICDEQVPGHNGLEARYEMGAAARSDAEHRVFIESCRLAMAGEQLEAFGQFAPIAGAPQATVMNLSMDDLIEMEDGSFTPNSPEPYNAVLCKFLDPAAGWELNDLPPLRNPAWEANDGNRRRDKTIDLQSVSRASQAGRIQKLLAEQSRMTVAFNGVFSPRAARLVPGNWVNMDFSNINRPSYVMKVVGAARDLATGGIALALAQCAASNYVPPATLPAGVPVVYSFDEPQRFQNLQGFVAQAGTLEHLGQIRPVLNVGWTAFVDAGVANVSVEYRILNNAASARVLSVDKADNFVSVPVELGGQTYQVRARPEFIDGRHGVWTDWAEVETDTEFTVLSARIAHDTQDLMLRTWQRADASDMLANALEYINRYNNDWIGASETTRSTMHAANATNTAFATIDEFKGVYANDQEALAVTLTTLNAAVGGVAAAVTDEALARATADSALGLSITGVMAAVDDVEAAVASEITARVDGDAALSTALTVVEATANGATAGGLFKIEAEASPVGVEARMIASIRASTGATFKTAGWVMEIFDSGGGVLKGRMVVEADQFAIKTSGTPFIPFAVVGADTYIQSLLIGGTVKSQNFVSGERGYALFQDGTAEFQNVIVGGGTSTKRPFELAFGAIQDGVLTDEASATFNLSALLAGVSFTVKGSAKRTPTAVEYSVDAKYNGTGPGVVTATATRAKGLAWAPFTAIAQSDGGTGGTGKARSLVATADGELRAVEHTYSATWVGTAVASVSLGRLLNITDSDPFFEAQIYDQATWHVWDDVLVQGIRRIKIPAEVLVSSVATPVVAMRVLVWAAAGQCFFVTGAIVNNALGPGGPGGFVKNDIAVTPGEVYSLLVGGTRGNGFGGQGAQRFGNADYDWSGGGGSFVARGKFIRDNVLLAAGGGSTGTYYAAGAAGGNPATSGGNASTFTDFRKCLGYSTTGAEPITAYQQKMGGGGYVGGGDSAGGTNYIAGPLINSANMGAAATGGAATTLLPPGTGEAAYSVTPTNAGGRANVGAASNTPGKAGGGRIAIQFLTSI